MTRLKRCCWADPRTVAPRHVDIVPGVLAWCALRGEYKKSVLTLFNRNKSTWKPEQKRVARRREPACIWSSPACTLTQEDRAKHFRKLEKCSRTDARNVLVALKRQRIRRDQRSPEQRSHLGAIRVNFQLMNDSNSP